MGFWDESSQQEGKVIVRGPFDALIHMPHQYPLRSEAVVREGFEVIYKQGSMPDSFVVNGVTYRREDIDG